MFETKKVLLIVLFFFLLVDSLLLFVYYRSSKTKPAPPSREISHYLSPKGKPLPLGYIEASDNDSSMMVIGKLEKVWRKDGEARGLISFGKRDKIKVLLAKDQPNLPFALQIQDVPDLFPTSQHFHLKTIKTSQEVVDVLRGYQGQTAVFSFWLKIDDAALSKIPPEKAALVKKLIACNRHLADSLRLYKAKPSCLAGVTQISIYLGK